MTAVLASRNRHKLGELRQALPAWRIEPLTADGYPEETGTTYYENALLKARFGRRLAPPESSPSTHACRGANRRPNRAFSSAFS